MTTEAKQVAVSQHDRRIVGSAEGLNGLGANLNRDELDILREWAERIAARSREGVLKRLREKFCAEHLTGFIDLLTDDEECAS